MWRWRRAGKLFIIFRMDWDGYNWLIFVPSSIRFGSFIIYTKNMIILIENPFICYLTINCLFIRIIQIPPNNQTKMVKMCLTIILFDTHNAQSIMPSGTQNCEPHKKKVSTYIIQKMLWKTIRKCLVHRWVSAVPNAKKKKSALRSYLPSKIFYIFLRLNFIAFAINFEYIAMKFSCNVKCSANWRCYIRYVMYANKYAYRIHIWIRSINEYFILPVMLFIYFLYCWWVCLSFFHSIVENIQMRWISGVIRVMMLLVIVVLTLMSILKTFVIIVCSSWEMKMQSIFLKTFQYTSCCFPRYKCEVAHWLLHWYMATW